MNAQYIERIEIDTLWNGHKHICWDLHPDINILSGVNGVGKSTILNRVIMHLLEIDKMERKNDGVHLTFFPQKQSPSTSMSFAPSTAPCSRANS